MNVLVFPCASGIGQEIFFALSDHKDVTCYGLNSGSQNPGRFLYNKNYISNAPSMQDPTFVSFLLSILEQYNIHAIFPALDDTQVFLMKLADEKLLPDSVKIITSSYETTLLCRYKSKTYALFDSILECPKVYSKDSIDKWPVFIKPDNGAGAIDSFKINTPEQLDKVWTQNHIICEYLPGEEFTVDCFTDHKGILLFSKARRRTYAKGGISIVTEITDSIADDVECMARKINRTIYLIGGWFFQCKYSETGVLKLLEIAPRIAGAMATYRMLGVNFPLLSLYAHLGKPTIVRYNPIVPFTMCKIYTNSFDFNLNFKKVYVDLDDTLIINKKVNTKLLKFLYECDTKVVPIILITRHKGDIFQTLNNYKLHPSLFTDIIHIQDSTKTKYEYMAQEQKCILIDDSFRERHQCGPNIFTFDVDAVECLANSISLIQ
jgi:hypothetical protein